MVLKYDTSLLLQQRVGLDTAPNGKLAAEDKVLVSVPQLLIVGIACALEI